MHGELPDEWRRAAGLDRFTPAGESYAPLDPDGLLVEIARIDAPRRDPGVVGLHRDRSLSILSAFTGGDLLPRIEVEALGNGRWRVRDGYHRYHLSVAVGFTCIPVRVVEPLSDLFATGDVTAAERERA